MELRKEQVVFIGTLAVLGFLARGKLSRTEVRSSRSRAAAPLFVDHPAPNVEVCLPSAGRESLEFGRELFSPPRDTAPLPQLELEMPPLESLAAMAPPTAFGPRASAAGPFLRRELQVVDVPGLFGSEDDELAESDDFTDVGGASDLDVGGDAKLSPEERAERVAGYKKLYDWIRIGDTKFGHITNEERYELVRRPAEPVRFVEVDPATGVQRFSGQGAIEYERERLAGFGFADTVANDFELRRSEFGAALAPSDLDRALAFADECVAQHLEAPRALDIAEEMYRLGREVADGDPRPELGLARCLEVGFDFEGAFEVYRGLLEGTASKSPIVHARMADLYARLRLDESAEASFQDALRWGRTNWEALWRYGRFLLEQGRLDEALETLAQACKFEPTSAETRRDRAALRADHARALLLAGQPQAALDWFERSLGARDGFELGLAGVVSARLVAGQAAASDAGLVADAGASFDLSLALGLAQLDRGDWEAAKASLEAAAEADPFRAHLAWRALSWLADTTGHPEEAFQYIELAYDASPDDVYTLFQRGRLLALQDDLEAATDTLQHALELDLDFSDALVAIGRLGTVAGDHASAERYLERALSIDPERPRVHSLRGFNWLHLGENEAAEASFRAALDLEPDLASAGNGLAWCAYLAGDSSEATTQFADLVERRRAEPEDDPHKAYAERQIARLAEHESKEIWHDRFERRAGERVGNEWLKEEPHGMLVRLDDGHLEIAGQATSEGRTRVYREIPAGRFVSFEAQITIAAGSRARVGAFVSRELMRRGEWDVQAEVSLSREKESAVQARNIVQGERDAQYADLFTTEWRLEATLPLRIELNGEGSEATATLYLDGLPVAEGLRAPRLGSATSNLRFGVFVETETGRSANVTIDNVAVIRRVN